MAIAHVNEDGIADSTHEISSEIVDGRINAHRKHGENSIEARNAGDNSWLSILVEEVGEVAHEQTYDSGGDLLSIRKELLDVGSVVFAWIASIDRELDDRE